MNELDDRIRAALGGLREAPVPAIPRLAPGRRESRMRPAALVAAAAMLILLAASLRFIPSGSRGPEPAVADRITALEMRISRIEDGELRSLMGRELALLRRELELSQAKE